MCAECNSKWTRSGREREREGFQLITRFAFHVFFAVEMLPNTILLRILALSCTPSLSLCLLAPVASLNYILFRRTKSQLISLHARNLPQNAAKYITFTISIWGARVRIYLPWRVWVCERASVVGILRCAVDSKNGNFSKMPF